MSGQACGWDGCCEPGPCTLGPSAPPCAACGHSGADHPIDSYGYRRTHCFLCACPNYEAVRS